MAIYSVAHNKNFVHFTNYENGRTYALDVNTGVFVNANTNKQIKSFPAGFGKFLDRYEGNDLVVQFLNSLRNNPRDYNIHIDGYTLTSTDAFMRVASLLNLIDRAQNVGCRVENNGWRAFYPEYLDIAEKNFKDFANFCRTSDNPSFYNFYQERGRLLFEKQFHAERYHLTDKMRDYLFNAKQNFTDEQMPYVFYYISRGLLEFMNSDYGTTNKLTEFFDLCNKLGVAPPKEDFFRSYINFKREYEIKKEQIDADTLRRVYAPHKDFLSFERNDLMVVIPQSPKDFEDEANAQHNCVFSMYLSKVLAGRTNVVFVRRKSNPTKPLITCEVDNNGRIIQFLKAYNQRPVAGEDDALIKFSADYALHLSNRWK